MRWRSILLVLLFAGGFSSEAFAQKAEPLQNVSVSFPGKSWMVEIDAPGFSVESEGRKPDGREYLLAHNSKTGIVLSVTLEGSKQEADPKSCPGYLKTRVQSLSELEPKDIQYSQTAQLYIVEYFLPSVRGIPLKQKNFVACTAKENVFVDIHLSKASFDTSEQALFTSVLDSVRFAEHTVFTASTTPLPDKPMAAATAGSGATSMDYLGAGSRLYLARDYRGAIAPYQAALDLEKRHRRLSQNLWRVLVDNLGMAYGMTGDLDRAEATFIYGASKDPNYPMFQYNLACVAGERGEMQMAMEHLQKAFALKAYGIPGEGMPDPRQDDSFQRFMTNPQFRKFAGTLMSSN